MVLNKARGDVDYVDLSLQGEHSCPDLRTASWACGEHHI